MTDTTQDHTAFPDPLGAVMEALGPLTDHQALRLLDAARARVVTLQPELLDGPAETAGQVMGPAGVAEVRDQWSGSVHEEAIVALCDSHEALRALAGAHDPTGADHMAEMWTHAQRADAAEARVAWLEGIEAAARTWRDAQRTVDTVLAGRPMDAAAYSAARPIRDAALTAFNTALDAPPPAAADGQ